jgi:hypothetical protein
MSERTKKTAAKKTAAKKAAPTAAKSAAARKPTTSKTAPAKATPSARSRRPAAKSKRGAVATWKDTYGELTRDVREAFAFLERDAKMTYARNVTPPECAFVYASPDEDLTLSVLSEYAGAPWLVVHWGGHAYPIRRLLRTLAPELVAREPKVAARSASDVRALLAFYARFLREQGRPIVEGDAELFASLASRRKTAPKGR